MVDDDIASIFATVAQNIEPDLAAVIAEATRQGRRRRARRRLAIAAAASVSVVAVVVATTMAAHLASAKLHSSPPAAPSHRHTPVVKPKPRHVRRSVPQASGPGMLPTQMLAVLRTLLPKGEVTYVAPYYMRGWLELNFNDADGKGAADIIVAASLTTAGPKSMAPDGLYCPNPPLKDEGKRPAGALPISCTRTVLRNGEVVMKEVTDADVAGYYDMAAYINRPDGITVSIDVGNGTLEGTPHLTRQGWPWVNRAVPPGSLAFWEKVVASPKWHV